MGSDQNWESPTPFTSVFNYNVSVGRIPSGVSPPLRQPISDLHSLTSPPQLRRSQFMICCHYLVITLMHLHSATLPSARGWGRVRRRRERKGKWNTNQTRQLENRDVNISSEFTSSHRNWSSTGLLGCVSACQTDAGSPQADLWELNKTLENELFIQNGPTTGVSKLGNSQNFFF